MFNKTQVEKNIIAKKNSAFKIFDDTKTNKTEDDSVITEA